MKKNSISRVTACAVAVVVSVALSSCVNEKYEISEERLDLNVTVFQEGLCLPLGSTAEIRLDSIIRKLGIEEEFKKYISASEEDGAYSFFLKSEEPLDLSEVLGEFSGLIDLDKLDLSQKNLALNLSQVDLSSLSYESGDPIGVDESLSEQFGGLNVAIPDIPTEKFTVYAGITEHAQKLENMHFQINTSELVSSTSNGFDLAEVQAVTIPDYLLTPEYRDTKISLNEIAGGNISWNDSKPAEPAFLNFGFSHELPKEVKSVESLHISSGASLKVIVEVENPFFTSGSITPHVELNISELFHLADDGGKVHDDTIDEDLTITAEDGWKAEDEFTITGITLNPDDDIVHDNGKVYLKKNVTLKASAHIVSSDIYTTPAMMKQWLDSGNRKVRINVKLELDHLIVDQAVVELEPVTVERIETFTIPLPAMNFPDEVKTIEKVTFTENSLITLNLSGDNIGDLDFVVTGMDVKFPEKFEVDGADADNTVHLEGGSVKSGLTREIKLKGIEIDDPVNGVVAPYEGTVEVKVKATVSGKINTGDLPTGTDEDMKLNGSVESVVSIGDYEVTINEYRIDAESEEFAEQFKPVEIKIPVPEELAKIKNLRVFFEGDPQIRITTSIPDITPDIRPMGEKGLVVRFPDMLKFKTGGLPYEEWFENNTLTFPSTKDFPEEIVLPLDYLSVNPVEEDGKYYIKGTVEVSGAVGVAEGARLTKADVELLAKPETKIKFMAEIPDLVPASADMDTFTASWDETISFEPLKGVEIPDMLVSVDEITLDDVYLSFAVKTGEGFPNIGDNASLTISVDVTMPGFVELEDERFANGILSIRGELEKGAEAGDPMQIAIDPIKIKAINIEKTRQQLIDGTLNGDITFAGNISLSGAEVVFDEWVGKSHKFDILADLKTIKEGVASEKILIDKVTGKLNFQIEPVSELVDLSEFTGYLKGDKLNATIDLKTFYVALDLTTNIGVPFKAGLSIIPYYGKEAGQTIERTLALDAVQSASEPKTRRIWLSDADPGNLGADDKFIELDVMSLLYKDGDKSQVLDSIRINLNAGTDAEKMCIYEPAAEYQLKVDYSAGIPLALGEDFMLEYRDTIALPQEAGMLMKYGTLGLGGEVESSMPIGFDLSVRLLDSKNQVLDMSDKVMGIQIKSCDASGNPVKTAIDLKIGNEKKADVSDLAAVELVFKADAKSAHGTPFKESSFIRATLHALIPEGVTIDAAGLLPKDEENADNE